jgi:hypothetical protein
VAVEGRSVGELDNFLFEKFKIHAVGIDTANIRGVRITPNVYTTTRDLDLLVDAISRFAKR